MILVGGFWAVFWSVVCGILEKHLATLVICFIAHVRDRFLFLFIKDNFCVKIVSIITFSRVFLNDLIEILTVCLLLHVLLLGFPLESKIAV